jgi:hypothetical protein
MTWERFNRATNQYVPCVRVLHPYADGRFKASHPTFGRSPCANSARDDLRGRGESRLARTATDGFVQELDHNAASACRRSAKT